MIELQCSNCGRAQQLDAAFAGCVCRCRYCAAIQTVPAEQAAATGLSRVIRGRQKVLHLPETAEAATGDRSLLLGIALAALLAIGAAAGALAWVHISETPAAGAGSIAP